MDAACLCNNLLHSKHYAANNLSCCYGVLYTRADADLLLAECEEKLPYMPRAKARVKVYGKWRDIPRQQVIC